MINSVALCERFNGGLIVSGQCGKSPGLFHCETHQTATGLNGQQSEGGERPPQKPKEENWFTVGLKYKSVRVCYLVSIGVPIVTTGTLLATGSNGEVILIINVPMLALFAITFMNHYRLGKRLF